jgi:hypothetical protein
MRLRDVITFQKALTLAAAASNPNEAAAAELAVRRILVARNINPCVVPDQSFLSRHINFADNPLLQKLREEYRALHPPARRGKRTPKRASRNKTKSAAAWTWTDATCGIDEIPGKTATVDGKSYTVWIGSHGKPIWTVSTEKRWHLGHEALPPEADTIEKACAAIEELCA